jgi:hypothetical protein
VAKLRRCIEGGIDRWSVGHGEEVGGGPAWHSSVHGEAAALGQAQGGRTGVTPCRLHRMGRAARLADWDD